MQTVHTRYKRGDKQVIDIIIDGLGNAGPPEREKWVPQKISKALAHLPKEITDTCFITIRQSTRSPVCKPTKGMPVMYIAGNPHDEITKIIIDDLDQFRNEFDIRIVSITETFPHRT